MARRRRNETAARTDPGGPPAELQSMQGVSSFRDPDEAVPVWVSAAEVEQWRTTAAVRRWLRARHDWCEAHGADYAQTFRPEWSSRPDSAA